MKKLTIFLCLLTLAGVVAPAKDKSSAKPKRTLKELIDLAMEHGEENIRPQLAMKDLGFTADINTRQIEYEHRKSKHITASHSFEVVHTSDTTKQPIALIWGTIEVNSKRDKKYYDGWRYRTNPDGTLQYAAHAFGYAGHVTQQPASTESSKIKRALRLEIDFFLNKENLMELKK